MSEFADRVSFFIKPWFLRKYGALLNDEMYVEGIYRKAPWNNGVYRVPGSKRIDLGTSDFKYGIEIKKTVADFNSGCGLNQERFAYGYVLCPRRIAAPIIGHLYLQGFSYTGLISVDDDDHFEILKPATFNPNSFYQQEGEEL